MYRITGFAFATLLFCATVNAQPCSVTIQGAPPGSHPTITAALATIPKGTGARLFISGICQEKVMVQHHVGVTLEGTPGSRLEPPAGNTERHPQALNIRESDNITVRTLTLRGTPNVTGAMSVWNSRQIDIRDLTIENGGSEGGAWIVNSVGVMFANVIVQNNGNGFRIDGQSSVSVQGAWEPGSTGISLIQNNITGVIARTGGQIALRGDTVVRNNNVGITTNGGDFNVCCFEDIAHPRIENNRFSGVSLRGGDSSIQGPLTVQDNGGFGVVAFGTDMRVADAVVQRNGGGIIGLSGRMELNRVGISNNAGGGLVFTEGQRGRATATTITGNGAEGIDVQMLSVLGIASNTIVRDNKGFDVRCSPNSHAHGSKEGVDRMQCPGFNNGPDPTPGGEN